MRYLRLRSKSERLIEHRILVFLACLAAFQFGKLAEPQTGATAEADASTANKYLNPRGF
jgi:hypothetical protein